MQIKLQIGKLRLNMPLAQIIATQTQSNGLGLLQIELHHIYALDGLPPHHKDPFDRLIVAQAFAERYTLVSADSAMQAYSVPILW